MDALKEHRLLLTLVGGVALSILVFMGVTQPARDDASQHLENISSARIDRVRSEVADAPTAGQIRARQEQRYEALRDLYQTYRTYLEWGRPLATLRVPGHVAEDDVQEYLTTLADALEALQRSYRGSMYRPFTPPEFADASAFPFGITGRDGGVFPTVDRNHPERLPLNRKRFWVAFELFQVLRNAVRRAGGEPYLRISDLDVNRDPRVDPTRLFQELPFRMTVEVSADVWPWIAHEFAQADPSLTMDELTRIFQAGGYAAVADLGTHRDPRDESSRVGLRFDRMDIAARVAPVPDHFSVDLATNERARALFDQHFPGRWIAESGLVNAPPVDAEFIRLFREGRDEREATTAAIEAQQEKFRDEVNATLYGPLRAALGLPRPSPVVLTIDGVVIDFLHNLNDDAVKFWDRLELSAEDVAEMLKTGVDPDVPTDEERWLACDLLADERTNLRPVYVPYPMQVNGTELEPFTPIRVSEAGLNLIGLEMRPAAHENDDD